MASLSTRFHKVIVIATALKKSCHKHVFKKHGWFYYLKKKGVIKVFPSQNTIENTYQLPRIVIT